MGRTMALKRNHQLGYHSHNYGYSPLVSGTTSPFLGQTRFPSKKSCRTLVGKSPHSMDIKKRNNNLLVRFTQGIFRNDPQSLVISSSQQPPATNPATLRLARTSKLTNILQDGYCTTNQYNYGKSPFLMGKFTINHSIAMFDFPPAHSMDSMDWFC